MHAGGEPVASLMLLPSFSSLLDLKGHARPSQNAAKIMQDGLVTQCDSPQLMSLLQEVVVVRGRERIIASMLRFNPRTPRLCVDLLTPPPL